MPTDADLSHIHNLKETMYRKVTINPQITRFLLFCSFSYFKVPDIKPTDHQSKKKNKNM